MPRYSVCHQSLVTDGVVANPESCLVAFKKADRLESTLSVAEADKSLAEKGAIVRAPYDQLLATLYGMVDQIKSRKAKDLAKLDESDALDATISAIISRADDDDAEDNAAEEVLADAHEGAKQQDAKSTSNTQIKDDLEGTTGKEIELATDHQEDEPPAKKPRTTCGICQTEVSKYKCPRCPLA